MQTHGNVALHAVIPATNVIPLGRRPCCRRFSQICTAFAAIPPRTHAVTTAVYVACLTGVAILVALGIEPGASLPTPQMSIERGPCIRCDPRVLEQISPAHDGLHFCKAAKRHGGTLSKRREELPLSQSIHSVNTELKTATGPNSGP